MGVLGRKLPVGTKASIWAVSLAYHVGLCWQCGLRRVTGLHRLAMDCAPVAPRSGRPRGAPDRCGIFCRVAKADPVEAQRFLLWHLSAASNTVYAISPIHSPFL